MGVDDELDSFRSATYEYHLQRERIEKILDDTIYKLRLLTQLPVILDNNGFILRQFLNKTEADFVVLVCQESVPFSRQMVENRSDLVLICNMLERINLFEKKGTTSMKRMRSFYAPDQFDLHAAYAADIIFKCPPLLAYMESLEENPDPLMAAFIDSMLLLQRIISERLSISAAEEIKKDNDLKTAYRSSMLLSENIQELEDLLEKQRLELGKEQERKEGILQDLSEQIERLKEKSTNDINRIIYESEVAMMRDFNKSVERQEVLSEEANEATRQYESLLEEHLEKEKVLRAKRLKVESQLASWITKYDTDIGEKQAEYDELEKTYNQEKEELDLLQEKFDEQEEEYFTLMAEKEEEEERIREEKGWIFLQNRSARRIQRAWRAYRARKLARKKARKSKKKGEKKGSAGSKRGSAKKAKKDKKDQGLSLKGGPDPNFLLEGKFGEHVLDDVKTPDAFEKKEVVVDLVDD